MGGELQEMERHLSGGRETHLHAGSGFPLVNLWTALEGAMVTAELPGVAAEDLDVSVLGDSLTIRGRRPMFEIAEVEDYVRRERLTGELVRTVRLPFPADPEQVVAEHRHGVLTIRLTRSPADLLHPVQETTQRATGVPATDIRASPDEFVLAVNLPGVDEKALAISLDKGLLTIHARRPPPHPGDECTLAWGQTQDADLRPSFWIHDEIDADKIDASLPAGVLTLALTKAKILSRRIEVKSVS